MMIYIFSDNIETGKSTFLFNWTKSRKDVYGVLTPKNEKGHRYILNVKTKKTTPLEAKPKDINTIAVGRYHFFKSAFDIANTIITNAVREEKNGYIIIDELGKLELISKGLHPSALFAIEKTRHHETLHTILVIRNYLLNEIKKQYEIIGSPVFNNDSISKFTNNVTLVTNN